MQYVLSVHGPAVMFGGLEQTTTAAASKAYQGNVDVRPFQSE